MVARTMGEIRVRNYRLLSVMTLASILLVAGCQRDSGKRPLPPNDGGAHSDKEGDSGRVDEAEIQAALARLDPEERRLAEAQGYCAVMTRNRLGVMGLPFKLIVDGQPVFLCCKGCRTQALASPAATLAKVEEAKKKTKADSK